MNDKYLIALMLVSILTFSCKPQQRREENATNNTEEIHAQLSKSLTFHASFDNGVDADFGEGDRSLYSIDEQNSDTQIKGLGNPPIRIASTRGRYGDALEFTQENSHVVLYNAENNITYSSAAFKGTFSFWMSVDPNEIPGQYCDPVQITDKDYSSDAIWIDITKNDTPPDLRMGVFGNQQVWDVDNKKGESEEFFWRLHKVALPPLAKGRWTHVVVTWNGLNDTKGGRARLYLDGEYKGSSSTIAEPFTWDVTKTRIRFGTGRYVGMFDDVAIFNQPLSSDEVVVLFNLKSGVAELYNK